MAYMISSDDRQLSTYENSVSSKWAVRSLMQAFPGGFDVTVDSEFSSVFPIITVFI